MSDEVLVLQKQILERIGQLSGLCKCKMRSTKPPDSDQGLCPWTSLEALFMEPRAHHVTPKLWCWVRQCIDYENDLAEL